MTARARGAWLVALLWIAGCGADERWYTANVDIVRFDVVRRDADGGALTSDVEVSYEECPGTQREVIRGGPAFSKCMAKHKLGDRLEAKVRWYKGDRGYYESKVHALGECARAPDPEDEASFTVVRDCENLTSHGAVVGFRCHYVDQQRLTAKCPWFRRL